jgi:hypothetical protein
MDIHVNGPSHHPCVLDSEEARTNFGRYAAVAFDVAREIMASKNQKVDSSSSRDTIKERSNNNSKI